MEKTIINIFHSVFLILKAINPVGTSKKKNNALSIQQEVIPVPSVKLNWKNKLEDAQNMLIK